jgi:hypothetical protein
MATKTKKPTTSAARPTTPAKAGSGKSGTKNIKATAGTRTNPATGAAARKPAARKLTDHQRDFLQKIHAAGEAGYEPTKAEQRTIDALMDRKLVKRGAKSKETGKARFLLTKAGAKHLPPPAAPAPEPAAAPAPEPTAASPAAPAP